MGFFTGLTLLLASGGMGFWQARSLSSDGSYPSLREKILLEQAKFNTCSNCYRDFAYEEAPDDVDRGVETGKVYQRKQANKASSYYPVQGTFDHPSYTIYKCKFCGQTKVVHNTGYAREN